MAEDSDNIYKKTWSRNMESVNKIGYMDGAADGQAAVFQTSFDKGYKQGFNFGLEIGLQNALRSSQQESGLSQCDRFRDPRKINCQICINGAPTSQNVVNLYNSQQEKNNEHTHR